MLDDQDWVDNAGRDPSSRPRPVQAIVEALQPLAACALTLCGADFVSIVLEDGTTVAEAGSTGCPPRTEACASEALTGAAGRRLGALFLFGSGGRSALSTAERAALLHLARAAAVIVEQRSDVEAALRRARDAFSQSPSPSWIYDLASLRFLDVNEAAVSFYGYSREQFLGMTVLDIRPPDERERMVTAIRDRSDLDGVATWRHRKAGGQDVDVITQGRGIGFDGLEAMIVVAIDLTNVQALRKDLFDTQLTFDTIAALPVGLFLKDMQDAGRYLLFNSAMEDIVGYGAGHVIGKIDHDVFDTGEGGVFIAQDREVMTTRRQHVYEADIQSDGHTRRIRTVKKPLPAGGDVPRYLLGISEDVTESRKFQDRIAYMALHDALTDLPNRVKFQRHVDRLIKRARRPESFALFYLDLDFFKTINDTYGHPVGDTLLKEVASRLTSNIRRHDLVARLGGDEFAVAARISHGEAEALSVADRILTSFDIPFELGECLAHVDTSIGIALSNGPGHDSGEALMRHADIALYAAKAEGRGIAKLYTDRMSLKVEERQRLSEDLRTALAEDQFELAFQPLYSLLGDRITGFEALIRWRHPKRGLIPPGDFIPVAEQTGLIVSIGEWVLREACHHAVAWPESVKIAVNLSAVQFKKAGLVETIERTLAETRLRPDRLELEITESVLLTDSGVNLQILHRLKAMGVKIAMDDFGTGYSSLSYLRSFPFDKIKMDRSFVADVSDSDESLAIIRAVTGLGASLSVTTTAEGVETADQFARLKAEGFDELQGYFIGRPMSADKATRLAMSLDTAMNRVSAA